MLSDWEIRAARESGQVLIEPFHESQLNGSSYDATLGPYVWRFRHNYAQPVPLNDVDAHKLFYLSDCRQSGVINLAPGEAVLAHTNEFIGATGLRVVQRGAAANTQMRATSTAGRYFLTACRCAGHGDCGYCDRWTLEVRNDSPETYAIEVGSIICQLVFSKIELPEKVYGQQQGHYMPTRDLERLMREWTPERMLPQKLKRTTFWRSLYEGTT